jgi:gas vesicle structural protein
MLWTRAECAHASPQGSREVTVAQVQKQGGPSGGGLSEVIDLVLDKGIVIDAWAKVSLVGIEVLGVQGRILIASVDTYLHYADAVAATATAAMPTTA